MRKMSITAFAASFLALSPAFGATDPWVSQSVVMNEFARERAACGLLRSVVHDVLTMRKADVSEDVMKAVLLHKITSMDPHSNPATGELSKHAMAWILDADATLLITSQIRGEGAFSTDPEADVFAAVSADSKILRASMSSPTACQSLAAF